MGSGLGGKCKECVDGMEMRKKRRTHAPPVVKANTLDTGVETKRFSSDDAKTERIKASKLQMHREACARRRQMFERGKREKMGSTWAARRREV